MEKLLKVEFFKSNGFVTKKDGMDFIESVDELASLLQTSDIKLQQFHFEIINNFSKDLYDFNDEKLNFISENKLIRKEDKKNKKTQEDVDKNTLLSESNYQKIEKEFYAKMFLKFLPENVINNNIVNINDKILTICKKSSSDDVNNTLLLLKSEIDSHFIALNKIYSQLNNLDISL